jgi:NAD(P)H-nitrite reductase large subunit
VTYQARFDPLAKQLRKLRIFRSALDRIYRIRPGLLDLACPDTTICRCEEISRQEIEEGIEFGGTNISTLKVITRAGMGPCQGKMCWPAVARLIADKEGKSVAEVGNVRVRPPIGSLAMTDLLTELSLDPIKEKH